MKFSIIIPLYNKEKTIRRALYSALDQNGVDENEIEIFVINDGSSDASVEEVIKVACENHKRQITLINQSNAGVSAARNRGVALSKGEFICFLDADDTYKPNFLDELDRLIKQHPECALFAMAYNLVNTQRGTVNRANIKATKSSSTNHVLPNFFLSAALGDLPFCASSIAIRKSTFDDLGGFPVGENMGEDQDLYTNIALAHKIAYCPTPCANYFMDVQGSLMNSQPACVEMPYSKRLQSRLDSKDVPNHLEPSIRRYISCHLRDLVRRNLERGHAKEARKLLKDKRSKYDSIKWLYWYTRYMVHTCFSFLGRTV